MHFRASRFVLAGAALTGLLAVGEPQRAQQASGPFTPEVEEFVDIYLKTGGDKLTNWVQGDRVSTPTGALRAFRPRDGLTMELVAAEPVIRQPVDLHFDERGRLWVVQYLQYPFPAGLGITSYDQYLRARYTGVPAAPPNHVRGADKITVLTDTDGDGSFDAHQDVITGLNITTSVAIGRGGAWVMNPPYLLFYPDRTGDGLPDDDPQVKLTGFGLEDTHSLANSLTWGPDGWLYGVHGSTSTSKVRGISFLGQAVWRYHPERDRFELFAEGGGNPWSLSFDSRGRAFSGDNNGNSRGFHWVQGGRYEKNWPKHGPFMRPHAYGFIPNMDHEGDPARFAMTSVVYEDGQFPGYEGQLISGMALTSRIQASRIAPSGSTFRTIDTDTLVTTADRSFRPVDTVVGPDGAVYVADWCDIRMDHTDPRDTWDKSCGRIWRLRGRTYQPAKPFDLARLDNDELLKLLGDSRKWYREQARRLLSERGERELLPRLQRLAREGRGQIALEAFWTATAIAEDERGWVPDLLDRPDPPVRLWALRSLHDAEPVARRAADRLIALARSEPDAEVRSELASLAARLDSQSALAVLRALIEREEDVPDAHIPLRIWWSLEQQITRDADAVLTWLESDQHPAPASGVPSAARGNEVRDRQTDRKALWNAPLFREHLAGRIARRLAADRGDRPSFTRIDPETNWLAYAHHPRSRMPGGKGDYTEWTTNHTASVSDASLTRLARLLSTAPSNAERQILLAGARAGLETGAPVPRTPLALATLIDRWWREEVRSGDFVQVAALLGHTEAVKARSAGAIPAPGGTADAATGRAAFLTHCAPCHQTDGRGMARLATPLTGSPLVLGREDLLVRVVLNGLKGELVMPAMGTLDDSQLAGILTYIRGAWGHDAPPISAATVARGRDASRGRRQPWTRTELSTLRVPD